MKTPQIGTVVEVDRGLYRHCGLLYGWSGDVPLVLANLPDWCAMLGSDHAKFMYSLDYASNRRCFFALKPHFPC